MIKEVKEVRKKEVKAVLGKMKPPDGRKCMYISVLCRRDTHVKVMDKDCVRMISCKYVLSLMRVLVCVWLSCDWSLGAVAVLSKKISRHN